jgi:4-amino-4-deoxy-L-arabinose transferase-like glycosyltransferase
MSLAAIALVVFVRILLRDAPLDDAEGEFTYTGQLMLQGIPPFALAASMKLPGAAVACALIMAVFGQTAAGLHLGLLLVNLATIIVLFFLGRRLFGEVSGWVAASSYALLSDGPGVLGRLANAEHFVVLPALLATLLLLRWHASCQENQARPEIQTGYGTLFWSGLLYGIAVLMKQSGVFFAFFGAVYLIWSLRYDLRSRAALLSFGTFTFAGLLPLTAMCAFFWQAGVFPKFWFWTVSYARVYASLVSPSAGARILYDEIRGIIKPFEGLWLLSSAGLVMAWIGRRHREPAPKAAVTWATMFLIASFLALCPGFYFRYYYFILLLPAVALFAGAGVAFLDDHMPGNQRTALFSIVLGLAIIPYFLILVHGDEIRPLYAINPFLAAGDYIRNHSEKDARVAVLGSEPEVYFYAQRHSATDYILTYALGENQPFALQMQNEMISEIEAAKPEYM